MTAVHVTATRKWIALTGAAIALILLVGWMVLLRPVLSQANGLHAEKVSQDTANEQTRTDIVTLQAQAKELEAQAERVKELQARIPDTVQLPNIIRQIANNATEVGADVEGISPAAPVDMGDSATAGAAPGTTSGGGDPLYMVPVSVKASGSFKSLESLLSRLEGLRRAFLVSGISVKPAAASSAEGEIVKGTLSLEITGRVFTRSPNTSGAGVGAQSADPSSQPTEPTDTTGGLG